MKMNIILPLVISLVNAEQILVDDIAFIHKEEITEEVGLIKVKYDKEAISEESYNDYVSGVLSEL